MRRDRGFTVVELLAVLVLSALLAGLAAVSMTGRGRAVRIEDAAGQLAAYARAARDHARRGDGAILIYDLRRREVRLEGRDAPPPLRFVGGFGVEQVRTPAGRVDTGTATIPLSAYGRGQTYAVKLGNQNAARWILFVGLTGRALEVEHEQEVQDILSQTTAGDDAR